MSKFSGSLGHSGKVETDVSSPDMFPYRCGDERPTYAPPFAILLVPHVSPLGIRQISTKLFVEDKEGDLAALELLPRAVRSSARAA